MNPKNPKNPMITEIFSKALSPKVTFIFGRSLTAISLILSRFATGFGLVILLTGCVNHQRKFRGTEQRVWVFPMGTYQHEISLKLNDGTHMNFNGIVQLKPERITVVGLSSFGTSIFKIQEDRATSKIESQIYLEKLSKFSNRLEIFYKLLRELLVMKSLGPQAQGTRVVSKTESGVPLEADIINDGKTVRVRLSDLDEHEIPNRIDLNEANFGVVVKVVGYDI